MRSLRLAAVWAAAAWVAFTVVLRIARGEVVILSGYAAPVVRIVALMLVFLAGCAEKLKPADPAERPDLSHGTAPAEGSAPVTAAVEPADPVVQEFPAKLTDPALNAMYRWISPRGLASRMATAEAARSLTYNLPEEPGAAAAARAFAAEVEAFHARQTAGTAETATTLTRLLAAAEAVPLYDAWLAGFVWLHARGLRPAPTELLARVERHLRVTHALVLAQASVGPVEFSAWRSKAGPPAGWRGVVVPPGLAAAARAVFDGGCDAGAFETGAVLPLTVAQGSVVLVRRAGETTVGAGAGLRLRRLDVIRTATGATLRHATLGALALPAGAEVTTWNVGEFLGADGETKVRALIDAALGGDAAALTSLEAILPAAQAAIRAAERARPDAPGAASLRTLLTAFDE